MHLSYMWLKNANMCHVQHMLDDIQVCIDIKTVIGLFEEFFVVQQTTDLKGRLQIFGVLKSQMEDSPKSLVKISRLLHEMSVVMYKVLDKLCNLTVNDGYCLSLSLKVCIHFYYFLLITSSVFLLSLVNITQISKTSKQNPL